MLKILKNLKKSFWSVVIIVVLLCLQAAADLALPDYTSKIVNIGIQSGGIETAVPKIILKEDMEALLIINNKDEIIENYSLIEETTTKEQEKIIQKYLGKNYKVEPNTIYVLNNIEEKKEQELSKNLATTLIKFTTIKNQEIANKIKEQMLLNIPDKNI